VESRHGVTASQGPTAPGGRAPDPSVWQGRRVFLTGHTGFKGGWLACWLQHMGAEVTGYALAPEPCSLGTALDVGRMMPGSTGDLRDGPALSAALRAAAPSMVFHLAAQPLVRRSYADPLETFAVNVMGTANLLQAVRDTPSVRAVLSVTTDKVYENREWAWPYRETDKLGGHDPYSASKAAAELVTASWRRSFLAAQGVAVATARAGNVVGGGDWAADRLVPDCARAFGAGHRVRIRNPRATRPWQHVLDPLCGYLLLAEALLHGPDHAEAWNFGPAPDDVQPVTGVVGLLAAAWGEGASWALDEDWHPHEAGLLAVDAAQARARLGWRPRLPLARGLAWTADWYKRHLRGEAARRLVLDDIARYAAGALA
jgi:CDP-glucose 4,6-dehydratase